MNGIRTTIHELKCWHDFYRLIVNGRKTFELRVNDRDFKDGDILYLREYLPAIEQYSGNSSYWRVGWILPGGIFGLADNLCIMSLLGECTLEEVEEAMTP